MVITWCRPALPAGHRIECFYSTVLGNDADHHGGEVAGMPLADLVTAWSLPFASDDITRGGCPAIKPNQAERFTLDQVHWSWDLSEPGGNCKSENGNVTIVPGSGGAKGQQVASCIDQGYTPTLYCQVTVNATAATSVPANGTTTGSAGALSLEAHWTSSGGYHYDGPVVHSGCSTVIEGGKPCPNCGKCCFV